MSELTPNLKLFKYNTETDAKQPFSINDCMNANWDKIDASLRINDKLTNCLLEVPQKIKLELNDGVLTLKAGSEVIVPNGFEADGTTPKFDYITIKSDISITHTGDLGASFVYYTESYANPALAFSVIGATISGASTKANYTIYNTSTNKVNYLDDNSEVQDERSLPIAIVQRTGSISSIDEVFNGFGYIGSTIFALPGVKGLMPNGRNEDGSLNNIEFTTQNILLRNNTTGNGPAYLVIVDGGTRVSIAFKRSWVFDEKSNRILDTDGIRDNIGFYGDITLGTNGAISNFNPKLPFRAVDYNDKSEISGWSMPSNKYIDLTLGASGTSYTAPANGYYLVTKQSTSAGQYVQIWLDNGTALSHMIKASDTGQIINVYLPVKKGDKVIIYYTAGGTTNRSRFIYAQGEV